MIIPEYLKPGDTVGVVASAKKVNKENTLKGIDVLRSWGLEVNVGENVFNSHYQFAGTDEQRLQDLQDMIINHEIKAIFMVRGGYGSTRIIDQVDFTPLKTYPKWIFGFSDITAIHLHVYKMGIASIHGPMPSFFYTLKNKPLKWLQELAFGHTKTLSVNDHSLNIFGRASGRLVGGNLSIICHTIGTASEIETKNNVLFIEDVGEQLYHLDRMMVQLKRGGFLDNLHGLIVGQFTEMKDDEDPFGLDEYQIIHEHVKAYNFPVAFNFPIGHCRDNHAVPVGLPVTLNIDKKGAKLNISNQESSE